MQNKILIIDIETTGCLNDGGSIVEIGAVELDLDSGTITEVFNSLCREKILTAKHRDAWIFSNSDLTPEQVRDAPAFEEVAREFQKLVDKYTGGLTAFNRAFDIPYLQDRGIKFFKLLACPMLLSVDICKIPGNFNKYKWPKVEEAFKHFYPDIEYQEKHRGADDARHEAMIVWALFQLGEFTI